MTNLYTDHEITTLSDPGPRYIRAYEDGREAVVVDSEGNPVHEDRCGFVAKDGEVHHMPGEFAKGGIVHKGEAVVMVGNESVLSRLVMGGLNTIKADDVRKWAEELKHSPPPTDNDEWWKWGDYKDE